MPISIKKNRVSLVPILVVVLILNPLFVAFAQQVDESVEARIVAEHDAQMDSNGAPWLRAGCTGCLLVPIIASVDSPSPPASRLTTFRLMGKSPEYIASYTRAYRAKARSIQARKAWTGFLVAMGSLVLLPILASASN
ncbi:hypothetical protein HYR99_39780 [Candidatus Poribacteria bacterium]|nr:hypothetical protein [Candidatus Poribacteria bacterium]